ncbi:MAG: hypothetical protein ACE5HA_10525, partial [Anaerolineae bacterium]
LGSWQSGSRYSQATATPRSGPPAAGFEPQQAPHLTDSVGALQLRQFDGEHAVIVINYLFCGLHVYVFVLALLITFSAWRSRLRWVGLTISALAFLFAITPLFNPVWLTALQLPGKLAILAGAILITVLTKRSDTRYIGFLLVVAAGGAVFAQMITF